jgi:hypothetical protein
MNLDKLNMLEKSVSKNLILPSNRHKKNFKKPPKIHTEDKRIFEEEQREKAFTSEDKLMTEEEKDYCKILGEEDTKKMREELVRTREMRYQIPKELRNWTPKGKKSKDAGFFTCPLCFQSHKGWYKHRLVCRQHMGRYCDQCNSDYFCSKEEHEEKECQDNQWKLIEEEISKGTEGKKKKKRKLK